MARTRQPQTIVSLNPAIPRPTFLFCPSVGLLDWIRPSRVGTKASGDSIIGSPQGVAYKVARATGGGLDFGVNVPLTSNTWTGIAFANPASGDGMSSLFSQRSGGGSYPQTELVANAGGGLLTASAGNLQFATYSGNTSTLSTSTGTEVDGKWNVYGVRRGFGGTADNAEIWKNGLVVASSSAYYYYGLGASQKFKLGGLADNTESQYVSASGMALVALWDGIALPEEIMRRMRPQDLWATLFASSRRVWVQFGPAAGGGAFELDAQPGGYSISGTAATLARGLVINAAPATYSVSGTAASVVRGYNLNAATGTFAATGAAAGLLRALSVNAGPGTFSLTGVVAGLDKTTAGAYTIDAQPGTYSLTGTAATLVYTPINAYLLDAQPGAYTLTGAAAGLTYAGSSIWTDVGVSAATWSDVGGASSIWTDL
jgi:hypothetical protein